MRSLSSIYKSIYKRISTIVWKFRLESFGHNSFIYKPLYVSGTNIHIGDNVYVQYKSWLASESLTGNGEALLKIGNGCVIGHFNEIYSTFNSYRESCINC